MRFTTSKKNKKASNVSLILMLSAVVLFFFAATGTGHGVAFIQLIGVLFLAGSAYFMMRAMTVYTYIIIPNDDSDKDARSLSPDKLSFIVSKRFGKGREVYQCQLDLSSLISVKEFPADKNDRKKLLAPLEKVNLFRYDATVGKHDSLLLVFHKRGQEKICIVAEPVDGMYVYLKTVVGINKEALKKEES